MMTSTSCKKLAIFVILAATHGRAFGAPSPAGALCGVGRCVRRIFGNPQQQDPQAQAQPPIDPAIAQHIHQILEPLPGPQAHPLPLPPQPQLPPQGQNFWNLIHDMMPDTSDDEHDGHHVVPHWAHAPQFQFTPPYDSFRVTDSGPLVDSAVSSPLHSGFLSELRRLRPARANETGWPHRDEAESSSQRVPSLHLGSSSERWLASDMSGSPRSHISDSEISPRSRTTPQREPLERQGSFPRQQPPVVQRIPSPQTARRVRPQPHMSDEMLRLYRERGWAGPLPQPSRPQGEGASRAAQPSDHPSDASIISESSRMESGRFSGPTSPDGSPRHSPRSSPGRRDHDKGKGKAPAEASREKHKKGTDSSPSSSDSEGEGHFEFGTKTDLPKPIMQPFGPGSTTQLSEGHKLPMPPAEGDRQRDVLRLGMPSPMASPHGQESPDWPPPYYGPLQRPIPAVERTESAPPATRQRFRRPPRPGRPSRGGARGLGGISEGGDSDPSPPRPRPLPRPPTSS